MVGTVSAAAAVVVAVVFADDPLKVTAVDPIEAAVVVAVELVVGEGDAAGRGEGVGVLGPGTEEVGDPV